MVAGLIIEHGRILLIHNSKHGKIRIEPPGGKVEAGESLQEATVREIREELGIEVTVGSLLRVAETDSPEGKFAVHMYLCRIVSGDPENQEPDKSSGFGWYSPAELLEIHQWGKLVPNLVEALPELIEHMRPSPTP